MNERENVGFCLCLKKSFYFCKLILDHTMLLNLSFLRVFGRTFGISHVYIVSSSKRDSLASFPICSP